MSKPSRGVPFTPMKRPQSRTSPRTEDASANNTQTVPGSVARYPSTIRAPTPSGAPPASPPKKIRAALTVEARPRSRLGDYSRPRSVLGTIPSSPKKPGTPQRNGNDSLRNAYTPETPSDPEEGLVDFQNVEVDPDASFELDDVFNGDKTRLSFGSDVASKDDKVLVSIRWVSFLAYILPISLLKQYLHRVRPTNQLLAWDLSNSGDPNIKLRTEYSRNGAATAQDFRFGVYFSELGDTREYS